MIPFNYKLIAGGVAILTAFVAGWTVNGWRHDAQLKEALQETINLQLEYDDYAREMAKKFQEQQAKQVIIYRDLKRKVQDVTDNRVCFANSDALSVWNNALTGMPQATTRAAETTTSTATDTEVLANAVENFEQAKQIRDQLNALIDWHENNK